jgi:LysM repeat protein
VGAVSYHRLVANDRPSLSAPQRRSVPARLLAPLALVATVVALIIVISNSGGGSEDPIPTGQGNGGQSTKKAGGANKKEETPKIYLVEPGDSLGAIAERFQISVDRILRLNDKVDPNALVTGQELKLQK